MQGVECFDYSHNLNVICSGGVDHAVRLWNPYVTAKPIAIMKGHQSSIIDLAIHEALEQVFSYDKDGVRHQQKINSGICWNTFKQVIHLPLFFRGTQRLVSGNICSEDLNRLRYIWI